ncbi:DNA-directed RNA polymerase II subunit RPB1-like isoform X3 [Portunus trituberculatus]|uniref:DNA-directed RNA polymerase II subunit RPB1-like isoform X3 n=1 Tax=Portunus trituberculatus TaxID=210409 RepID=UPI001E1CB479|nr:DNA-directed RNA polymerase II subunit RPB1-like isoform X3 [Portunus trituberculatus]
MRMKHRWERLTRFAHWLALIPRKLIVEFLSNTSVKGTKCNLEISKGDINDPCESLYGAVCGGTHCICPPGTFEDKTLLRCNKNRPGGSQGGNNRGAVDDLGLPLDYEPNKPAPAPAPPKPKPPQQPQPGYNPNQPGYNPNQPGYNPNQPGYNPNQPGYNPNQPGYNPNQPGYNPNQPGYNPNQPGYNPNHPGGTHGKTHGKDENMGEEVGGGVGGLIFLLIMGGLIYFCCCRGGKHKQVMNRFQGLPFMNRGQQAAPGGAVPMQSTMVQQDPNFSSQHTYVPPDAQQPPPGQYPPPAGGGPPMQPYPPQPYPPSAAPYVAPGPPEGYAPPGQQPPPYTQQYQPNAPPPM